MELDPKGVDHEFNFWKGFVKSERFKDWVGNYPTPELNQLVRWLISGFLDKQRLSLLGEDTFYVLDVGSGPVSILNGLDSRLRITTADPLSHLYQQIFDYDTAGISPPLQMGAENVTTESYFDLVHISNALDHSFDPVAGLKNLVDQVTPETGHLIVQGFVDEAVHERYQGFHQHNLSLSENGRTLNLGSKEGKAVVQRSFSAENLGCEFVSRSVISMSQPNSSAGVAPSRMRWTWRPVPKVIRRAPPVAGSTATLVPDGSRAWTSALSPLVTRCGSRPSSAASGCSAKAVIRASVNSSFTSRSRPAPAS